MLTKHAYSGRRCSRHEGDVLVTPLILTTTLGHRNNSSPLFIDGDTKAVLVKGKTRILPLEVGVHGLRLCSVASSDASCLWLSCADFRVIVSGFSPGWSGLAAAANKDMQ